MAEDLGKLVVSVALDSSSYTAGLKTLSKSTKAAEAEFKNATAGVEDFGQNLDALGAKAEYLEKAIYNQAAAVEIWSKQLAATKDRLAASIKDQDSLKQKLEATQKAYKESAAAAGEDAKETQNLEAECKKLESALEAAEKKVRNNANSVNTASAGYNNAQADLKKLQKELDVTGDAMNKAAKNTENYGDALGKGEKDLEDYSGETDEAGEATSVFGGVVSDVFSAFGVDVSGTFDKVKDRLSEYAENLKNSDSKTAQGLGSMVDSIMTLPPAAGIAAAAVVAIGVEALNAAKEVEESSVRMKVALGLTKEESKEAQEAVENVYRKGLYENREDAEEAVTAIMQLMRLTAEEAEAVLPHMAAMMEYMGADAVEAARTASTMMEQFGVTAEEAFAIMIAGSQTSANQNGDLLDVLNEYSPQFAAMGKSAEDMLAILITGTENGAYSAEKLADAYKEGFIRMREGSDATSEALSSLGLNADQIITAMNEGGTSADEAFERVIARLDACKDSTTQNAAAAEIFGTQWEDVGTKALTAAAGVQGSMENVKTASDAALNEISSSWATKAQSVGNTAGKAIWESFVNSITFGIPDMVKSTGEAWDTATDKICEDEELKANTARAGLAIPEGMAKGITGGTHLVVDASVNMAQAGIDAANETLDSHSPSEEFRKVGLTAPEGMAGGIEEGTPDVEKASEELGESAIEAAAKGADEKSAEEIGRSIVEGIGKGAEDESDGLFGTLKDIAGKALQAAKDALGIRSPSRKARREIGPQLVQGIGLGASDQMPKTFAEMKAEIDKHTAALVMQIESANALIPYAVNNTSSSSTSSSVTYGGDTISVAPGAVVVDLSSLEDMQTLINTFAGLKQARRSGVGR